METLELDVLILYWEKRWEFFRHTDEKRIKSLFYLIIITIIFFLFLVPEDNEVLLFNINVPNIALIIIPLFIWLLTLRYFFLSDISLSNHLKFNVYNEEWKKRLDTIYKTEIQNAVIFNENNIAEIPNLYRQFYMKINKGRAKIGEPLESIASLGINIIYYAINFISVFFYTYLISKSENTGIIIYLIILIFLVLTSYLYFAKRTRDLRYWLSKGKLTT